MNENLPNPEPNKTQQFANKMWMFLLPLFALLALYQFYSYTQGRDNLRSILSPIAFICLGVSILLRPRNPSLANALLAAVFILVAAQVILMILY